MIEPLRFVKESEYIARLPDKKEMFDKINEIVDLVNHMFDMTNENRKELKQIKEVKK